MVPLLLVKPMIVRKSVVLPAPLRPTSATVSAGSTLRSMSRRIGIAPMAALTDFSCSMAQPPITLRMTSGSFSTTSGSPVIWMMPWAQTATRLA